MTAETETAIVRAADALERIARAVEEHAYGVSVEQVREIQAMLDRDYRERQQQDDGAAVR